MRKRKSEKLEAAGWSVGSVDELLGLSEAETRAVSERVASKSSPRVPEGWTFEPLERLPDHALISTPPPSCMATIDFRARGFRSGYSLTGWFIGEKWNKRRKKYGGRGWRQVLVDDAVAYLQELLR